MADKTIQYYSDNAQVYADKFNRSGPRVRDIRKAFNIVKKENARVLELGCANGRDTKEILKNTSNYLGIDGAKGLLKIFKKEYPNTKCILSDFRTLELKDSTFDIIFDFASLFHLEKNDLTKIIKKIGSWLSPDGLFVMNAKYGEYKKIMLKEQGLKIQYLYTPEEIIKISNNRFIIKEKIIEDLRGQKWFTVFLRKI